MNKLALNQLFFQLLPVLAANIGALSSGLALGYSAVLLPQLRPVCSSDHLFFVDFQEFLFQDENAFLFDDYHGNGALNVSSTLYRPFTADPDQGSWIGKKFATLLTNFPTHFLNAQSLQ